MRKKMAVVLLAAGALLLAGLAAGELDRLPLGKSPHKTLLASLAAEKIMLTAGGNEADMAALVEAAVKCDVIVVGEYHDNWAGHKFQADFIAAIASRYPRLVVGFEFFERGHDDLLEQWRTGKIGEAELLQATGWYKRSALNYGYTRPVMEAAKKHALRIVGLNVPRDLIRRVSLKGFAALTADEKRLFPGWEAANPDHEFYIRATFGPIAVQVPQWFSGVYGAQKCWDVVMAESMRGWLAKRELRGCKGVIIAGSGHVAYKLSIPFRYNLNEGKAKIFTVVPVYVDKQEEGAAEENPMLKMLAANRKPAAVFSRGIADAVLALAPQEKPFFPVLGFSGKMAAEGYEVGDVGKEGLAEKWGLNKGDLITAVDGKKIASEEELRTLLAAKNWGDAALFELKKKVIFKN